METTVIKMKFGSHLYGTDTADSDLDYKEIRIPDMRDVLLQRAFKVKHQNSKTDDTVRNTWQDTDVEIFSIQHYLHLLSQGQTNMVDMLFAPKSAWLCEPHNVWKLIQLNRQRLISKKTAAFVGYCRQQANKYGIKGSRMAEARAARDLLALLLEKGGTQARLFEYKTELQEFVVGKEHSRLVDIPSPNGESLLHISVCERKAPLTNTVKTAYEIYDRLFKEYGKRAEAAEKNEGIDWKALSHAVRVGTSSIELFTTGEIAFPLKNARELRLIKAGKISFDEVREQIELLLPAVEKAGAECTFFKDEIDAEVIDLLALVAYNFNQ